MTSRQHMDCMPNKCLVQQPLECPWFAHTKPERGEILCPGQPVRLAIIGHALHQHTGVLVGPQASDQEVWIVALDNPEDSDMPGNPTRAVHTSYLRLMPPIIDELPV